MTKAPFVRDDDEPSELTQQLFGPVGGSQGATALQFAFEKLSKLGATPPQESRLVQARDLLTGERASRGLLKPGNRQRRLVAESHRLAVEWWMIAVALRGSVRNDKQLRNKLQRAYTGNLDPADDSQLSARARDTQFELYLAAWFAMGGRPVHVAEPDLRVAYWFNWYGVAAKRVRTPSAFVTRVQEGARQVAKSTTVGFVAAAIDDYSSRRNRVATSVGAGDQFFAARPQIAQAAAWLDEHAPWVRILFTFGFLTAWRIRDGIPFLESTLLLRGVFLGPDSEERQQLQALFEEQRRRFFLNWERVSGPPGI